ERLEQHRRKQLEEKLKIGSDWENRNLVFTDLTGGYFNPQYLARLFPKILAEAGLPSMRFHDLRHSAATLLLEMGVSMKVVQEILGHSSYMITADTYTHVLPAQQPEAMKHWDEEFNNIDQEDKKGGADD
ncbi:MAG: tyrosine-type recombinase/integrase, partial [Ktedonobacteraceae bacterium]